MGIEEAISKAGKNKKTIIISYVDSKGKFSSRETEPYKINDGKYFGFCLSKNGIRAFNISSIITVTLTDKSYTPRWPVEF